MLSATDTLVIKHLPPDLSDSDKEELLKYFGAKDVKCLSSKVKKYNVVFARFQNKQVADSVLRRLHQLKIGDNRLSVEYIREKDCVFQSEEQSIRSFENEEDIENEKCYNAFIEKLNSWHSAFNFRQPVPNHLRYQYPPPNDLVLSNIAKVLATVPKFYTQVLHLMNKMNLPCPFKKDILPGLNIQLSTIFNPNEGNAKTIQVEPTEKERTEAVEKEIETSESEISSDEDIKIKQKETIPDQVTVRKKKIMNLPKFVKPVQVIPASQKQSKKTTIEEVFEKVSEEREVKKVKLSHLPPANQPQEPVLVNVKPPDSKSGFGYLHPLVKPSSPTPEIDTRDEREEERLEKQEIKCISSEELAQNRISEKDRSILPVFKNYAEGAPTCRLYIKNLAKTVTEEDLRFIYNRYLPKDIIDAESYSMDIRLMQEGRMKGQAFVTLQNNQLAQTALKETNGFILKDKPLVVQFARSATK